MPAPTPPPDARHLALTAAIGLSLVLWGLFAVGGWWATVRVRALPKVVLPVARTAPPVVVPMPPIASVQVFEEAGPLWSTLSATQQRALAPLEPHWSTLTEGQKRRWISLAAGFRKLSKANQTKMQERMTAWANLTPEQRSRARLNYAVTKKLDAPVKQEQWEAYQALSQDQKKEFASRAAPPPQGAATAVHPVPQRKFARVPAASGAGAAKPNPPKILPPVEDLVPVPVPVPAQPTEPATAVVETAPVLTPTAPATPLPALAPDAAPPAESHENHEPAAVDTDPPL
ncbi:MAG: DUF3106 domain-containing protein [Burkholderiales bacterium]|nr:DUF3106 domain-containing protein [Burkholderiales bacterium]